MDVGLSNVEEIGNGSIFMFYLLHFCKNRLEHNEMCLFTKNRHVTGVKCDNAYKYCRFFTDNY